jgi:hypothetical protein
MNMTNLAAAMVRNGGRMAGGLLAAGLLMPLPALALTFTGSWQAATYVSGAPTPTAPTFTDSVTNVSPNQQDDNLTVNLGTYQGATQTAISSIALARGITVSSPSEAIDFADQFAAQFKQAGVNVAVAVFNSKGQLVAAPLTFSQSTNSTAFTTISANQNVTQTFKAGNYTLAVGIAYNTNNKMGGWKAISRHHFEFVDAAH